MFASDRPLRGEDAALLLAEVDQFLERWQAHGAPLRCAREWRNEHFLAIGIDPTAEQASGCSIDGLFRELQRVQGALKTNLVGGGRVFFRDRTGAVRTTSRAELRTLAARTEVDDATPVFDTSLMTVGEWRTRFEQPARASWVRALLADAQASQSSSR
ncbi:MAG TPA: hypothetical protein VJ867_05865 [Gemmatimonadaceae bacterium]|nr:hypothetical protein [Gemmatimonadaceae bacterium]